MTTSSRSTSAAEHAGTTHIWNWEFWPDTDVPPYYPAAAAGFGQRVEGLIGL